MERMKLNADCFGDIEGHDLLIESTRSILESSDTSIFLGDIFKSHRDKEMTYVAANSFSFIKYLYDKYADKTFNPEKDYWQYVKNSSGIFRKNTPIERVERRKINFLIGNKEYRMYRKALHGDRLKLKYFQDKLGWSDSDLEANEEATNWYYSRCRAMLQEDNILFVHNYMNIDRISLESAKQIDTIVCGHNRSTRQFDYYSPRHNKIFKVMMLDLSDLCKYHEGIYGAMSDKEESLGIYKTGSLIKGTLSDPLVNCIKIKDGIPSFLSDRICYINHYLAFSDDICVGDFNLMRLHPQVLEKLVFEYKSNTSELMARFLLPFARGQSMVVQWNYDKWMIPTLAAAAADFILSSVKPRQALFVAPNREFAARLFKGIKKMTESVSLVTKQHFEKCGTMSEVVVTTASFADRVLLEHMDVDRVELFVVDRADLAVRFGQLEKLEKAATALKGKKIQAIVIGELIPYRAQQLAFGYCQIPIGIIHY